MPARLLNFGSFLVALFAALAIVVCVGCVGDQHSDGSVANSGAGGESESRPTARVAMSKEAFVDYVANESPGRPEDGFVLFVKLPGKFTPEERTEKYAIPIDSALEQAELGNVINGAAMMGAKPFSSVSVEVSKLAMGLEVIIETLRSADAPPGTEIRYGEGDDKKFLNFDRLK